MKKTGKSNLKLTLVCTFLAAVLYNAYSSEEIINMHAIVDASRVGLLDTINLTVTVDTESAARLPGPDLPDFKYFTVLNESTKSQTSISIVNGKKKQTKTITHTYLLKPGRKGTFTIEPISIRYKGEEYKTDPITITVVEGHLKPEGTTLMPGDSLEIDVEKLKEEIFIIVKPETSTIFEGEQLLVTYTLFSRLDIDSIALRDSPDFSGFYKEDIYNATRLEHKKETREGKIYRTTMLKKAALFPLESGIFSPQPLVLETTVIAKSDDLFSFFGRPYNFLIESNKITITAKPLPENKTNREFSYIVGELFANISKRENVVNTGESTTFYLTLKSSGNLNTITEPDLHLSLRGRVYLSETKSDRVEENDKIYLIKKFEYTVIPEESGVLEVKINDFLYFDLNSRSYSVLNVEPVRINVTGKDIYQEKPIIGSKREFSEGGFNFIKGNVKVLKNQPKDPFKSPFYYFYHLVLLAAIGILFFARLKREKLEQNESLFKKKKAKGTAMGILQEAKAAIDLNNYAAAVDLIYSALSTYIAHKCGKSPQEITIKNISEVLKRFFSIKEDVKNSILNIIEQCTMLKFSTQDLNEKQKVDTLYKKAVSAVTDMEASPVLLN